MDTIHTISAQFQKELSKALKLVKESNVLQNDIIIKGENSTQELIAQLKENFSIKVPIVGDFSAGKSSLLNAFIGKEILPTSIRPETAVSYELYYAPVESAELYRNSIEITKCQLADIKSLEVVPGDIVKVFIDNTKIKDLYNNGITLVDMPGSDSGIEAHQKAIISYLQEGSAFVTLVDIEQGSIKGSNLKFMQEILSYNLSSGIIITKADKKTNTEQIKIKDFILEQVHRYDKSNSSVGIVSALDGEITEFENVINNLDSAQLFNEKYQPAVNAIINQWLESLELEFNVTSKTKEDLQLKLQDLIKSSEVAKDNITAQQKNPEQGMYAVENILQNVKVSLENKSGVIGNYLVNEDNDSAHKEITETIRPILINSLKEAKTTMADKINLSFDDINNQLNNFIGTPDKAVNLLQGLNSNLKNFKDKVLNNNSLSKYKIITSIIGITTSAVAPWLELVIVFAPEILNMFFGKKDEADKLNKAILHFKTKSIPEILARLKPEVEKGIEEERQAILAVINAEIEQRVNEINERIIIEQNNLAISDQEKDEKLKLISSLKEKIQLIK